MLFSKFSKIKFKKSRSFCSSNVHLKLLKSTEFSKEAILNQLKEMTISCKNVTFKIFGLSLATFNVFISLILGVITTKLFLNYEKNK